MKHCLLNKQGKFGVKIFLHYKDIVIFVLGHFILIHPVHCVPKKRHTLSFPYLWQILTDFHNYFTGTLRGQFAIKRLLNISPRLTASLHYLVKYKLAKNHYNQNKYAVVTYLPKQFSTNFYA